MPAFRRRVSFEVLKNIKAFLNFETRLTRCDAPGKSQGSSKLAQLRRRLVKAERENVRLRARLDATGVDKATVEPGNIVWIFGSGRSGSTWLARMMGELEDFAVWNEPLVGTLFGDLYYVRGGDRIGKKGKHFILGGGYRESWLEPMRDLVLRGAAARFPELSEGGYLVVKEPNGSVGAPLLMETLPESRIVLLVRDPRDVVASNLDAHRKESWASSSGRSLADKRQTLAEVRPDAYVRLRADMYLQSVGNAMEAYGAHQGHKALVCYEELRSDTLTTMKRIYSTLDLPVDEEQLAHVVEKHAWENIPEEQKGEGKFYRKGTSGGWREDLTPKQVEIVEEVTAPILEEFYPD